MEVVTSRTIVHPSDLERSLAFYGGVLDLPVVREFGAGAGRGVVFAAGGGHLEVVGGGGARGGAGAGGEGDVGRTAGPTRLSPAGRSASVALWLQVRSAGDAVAEVEARGATVLRGPVTEPWGLVEAWIEDPDGLHIHLVEVPADHPLRRDPRAAAAPPSGGGGR